MKRLLCALGLAALVGLGACEPEGDVVVSTAPPPPRVEVVTTAPYAGATWIPGYWHWTGRDYTWRPGHWERGRPGWVWIPHHYERRGPVWHYVPGHWRRI